MRFIDVPARLLHSANIETPPRDAPCNNARTVGHVTRFNNPTTHAPFGIAFHPVAGPRATPYGYAFLSSAAVHCVLRALLAVRTAETCAAVTALALLPHCVRMYVTTFATS